jgi:hypothetical protein
MPSQRGARQPRMWAARRVSGTPRLPAQQLPPVLCPGSMSVGRLRTGWGARTRRPGAASAVDRQPGASPTGDSTSDACDRLEPGAPE